MLRAICDGQTRALFEGMQDVFVITWCLDELSGHLTLHSGWQLLYGYGYVWLTEIVERMSSQTLDIFAGQDFFGSLGVKDTRWGPLDQ